MKVSIFEGSRMYGGGECTVKAGLANILRDVWGVVVGNWRDWGLSGMAGGELEISRVDEVSGFAKTGIINSENDDYSVALIGQFQLK